MKCLSVGGLLLVLQLGSVGQVHRTNGTARTPERILFKAERDWAKAVVARDARFLDGVMSDDFVGWDYEGKRYTKTDLERDLNSGEWKTTSLEIDDISVRVLGNTAIVTSRAVRKGQYKGTDNTGQFRWTKVYLKKLNQWKVLAQQSTRIAQP